MDDSLVRSVIFLSVDEPVRVGATALSVHENNTIQHDVDARDDVASTEEMQEGIDLIDREMSLLTQSSTTVI